MVITTAAEQMLSKQAGFVWGQYDLGEDANKGLEKDQARHLYGQMCCEKISKPKTRTISRFQLKELYCSLG